MLSGLVLQVPPPQSASRSDLGLRTCGIAQLQDGQVTGFKLTPPTILHKGAIEHQYNTDIDHQRSTRLRRLHHRSSRSKSATFSRRRITLADFPETNSSAGRGRVL